MNRLRRIDPEAETALKVQLAEAETELRRIETEESRLLEAYRSEIITAMQLGPELEKLKARRSIAEHQKAELLPVRPPVEIKKIKSSVEEYCLEVKQRFRALSPEQLQEFFRTVIRSIVFEGHELRIQGHLPVCRLPEEAPVSATDPPPDAGPVDITASELATTGNRGGHDERPSDAAAIHAVTAQGVTDAGVSWRAAVPLPPVRGIQTGESCPSRYLT